MPYKDKYSQEAIDSHNKRAKTYWEKTREEQLIKNKICEKRIKTSRINNWKRRGVLSSDYDRLYNTYINCNYCYGCGKEFTETKNKCLDHNHNTGFFRMILCRDCNSWDLYYR
mgnify:CR=1 FL=1|jgi:hypothetical protein